MSLVKYPDPVLLKPSEECKISESKEDFKLLEIAVKNGFGWGTVVGLAAPQIGISKSFFIALDKLYINPRIVSFSKEKYKTKEGCYSLKENKFDYPVKRHSWIILEWIDRGGNKHVKKFDGFKAQVIQHECDHLLGKLCNK